MKKRKKLQIIKYMLSYKGTYYKVIILPQSLNASKGPDFPMVYIDSSQEKQWFPILPQSLNASQGPGCSVNKSPQEKQRVPVLPRGLNVSQGPSLGGKYGQVPRDQVGPRTTCITVNYF